MTKKRYLKRQINVRWVDNRQAGFAWHKRISYFRTRIRTTVKLFKYGRHKKMWQRSMQRIKLFQAKDEVFFYRKEFDCRDGSLLTAFLDC